MSLTPTPVTWKWSTYDGKPDPVGASLPRAVSKLKRSTAKGCDENFGGNFTVGEVILYK
ncbi:hypothetical protein D3C84_1292540 [compost metagenome]